MRAEIWRLNPMGPKGKMIRRNSETSLLYFIVVLTLVSEECQMRPYIYIRGVDGVW